MARRPSTVNVELNLKLFKISGTWIPNDVERQAAWELYVELMTRTAAVPLSRGLLREALTSMHSLFPSSREILRRSGPSVADFKGTGDYNLAFLTVALLNFSVRPVLDYWHPELEAWESRRPAGASMHEHELAWSRNAELRGVIADANRSIDAYAHLLADACGIMHLSEAIPKSESSKIE